MSSTKVVLLGTGSPSCLPEAYQAAAVVIVGDQAYVIDCGGGIVQRLAQAAAKYELPQLDFSKLTKLFITHLHPDHTVGLADFLIAPWVRGRAKSIEIFGPAGTPKLVSGLLGAYELGIAEHRDGIAPIVGTIDPQVHSIQKGVIYQDALIEIEAFPVAHGGLESYGFKMTTADGIIVFSGDTNPVPQMVEQAAGCDLLIHEVYNHATLQRRPAEWQAYFHQSHTSTHELAQIAQQTRPKQLVTTHNIYFPPDTAKSTLKEITNRYDGPVMFGRDLDMFEI